MRKIRAVVRPNSGWGRSLPKNSWRLFYFLIFVLFLYQLQHLFVMNIDNKTQVLDKEIEQINRENEKLQIELYKNISLENIDNIAVSKLGMIRPEKVEFIVISVVK